MPKISIIIPVFNQLEYTKKLVSDIGMLFYMNDCEFIFVDNGSTDGTREYIYAMFGNIITNTTPFSINANWNLGVVKAKGEYVRIINNDIRLTEHIDKKLIDELDRIRKNGTYVMCPMSTTGQNEREIPIKVQHNNICGWCFMIKKSDCKKCFPIPDDYRLRFGDNYIFEKLGNKCGFGGGLIHHYESSTIMMPSIKKEIDNIIKKDRLNWELNHCD